MGKFKWLYPGLKLKRWAIIIIVGIVLISVGVSFMITFGYKKITSHDVFGVLIISTGIYVTVLGIRKMVVSIYEALIPDKKERIIESLYQERYRKKGSRIVVIGGGTGLSTMLRGIKKYSDNITAIVTVADDGGSSGLLRDAFGILPPGDIRNCLVALADTEPLMEKLFQYRFTEGTELKGHSFGNLFIATLTDVLGDFEEAIKESSKVLAIKGRVLPSTLEDLRLSAKLKNGEVVQGESQIPEVEGKIEEVFITPKNAEPLPEAITAIEEADIIILGPGSLYTSILPNLLLKKLTAKIKETKAIKLYICNVMTQPGETDNYTVSDHLKALHDHVGRGIVDYVLVNSGSVSLNLLKKYAEEGAEVVHIDWGKLQEEKIKVIQRDLINESNLVRHDPEKLAKAIIEIVLDKVKK